MLPAVKGKQICGGVPSAIKCNSSMNLLAHWKIETTDGFTEIFTSGNFTPFSVVGIPAAIYDVPVTANCDNLNALVNKTIASQNGMVPLA